MLGCREESAGTLEPSPLVPGTTQTLYTDTDLSSQTKLAVAKLMERGRSPRRRSGHGPDRVVHGPGGAAVVLVQSDLLQGDLLEAQLEGR